jgi:hypothetical protein
VVLGGFKPSESESGISFAQKTPIPLILNWWTLVVRDCTLKPLDKQQDSATDYVGYFASQLQRKSLRVIQLAKFKASTCIDN